MDKENYSFDKVQFAMLKRGIDEWNGWRKNNREIEVELQGADFASTDLQNAFLAESKLQGARLHQANLCGANLAGANLNGADLTGAELQDSELSWVKMTGATVSSANLQRACLQLSIMPQTVFSRSDLREARLDGANLQKAVFVQADLEDAILEAADLQGATLKYANLKGANLNQANLKGADLYRTDLQGATLSGTTGVLFHNTNVRGINYSTVPSDPWSVLKRKYTGPAMIWTLGALVGAFVPFLGKALYWSAFNRYQQYNDVPFNEESYERFAVVSLIIGIDKGSFYWLIPLLLIVYNVMRGFLTYCVAPLRDLEESSGFTPKWTYEKEQLTLGEAAYRYPERYREKPRFWYFQGYRPLFLLHQTAKWVGFLALVVFFYNAWYWLSQPVWLPKE